MKFLPRLSADGFALWLQRQLWLLLAIWFALAIVATCFFPDP